MNSSVRFQLAPPVADQPYQQVTALDVAGHGYWQDPDASPQSSEVASYDETVLALPSDFAAHLLEYASRRIKSKYDLSAEMRWCHSFAMEVGRTATESMLDSVNMDEPGVERATSIVVNGMPVHPDDLEMGEHGVIGNPYASSQPGYRGARLLSHSVVGLDRGRSIQLDGYMGRLYVGRTSGVLDWYRGPRRAGGGPENGLYVHRPTPPPIRRNWRRPVSIFPN